MKWVPPQLSFTENGDIQFFGPIKDNGNQDPLSPIPSSFRDTPDIIKHLSPHILEEGIQSLHQEFLENSSYLSNPCTFISREMLFREKTMINSKLISKVPKNTKLRLTLYG